jgi:hypothetical protein
MKHKVDKANTRHRQSTPTHEASNLTTVGRTLETTEMTVTAIANLGHQNTADAPSKPLRLLRYNDDDHHDQLESDTEKVHPSHTGVHCDALTSIAPSTLPH